MSKKKPDEKNHTSITVRMKVTPSSSRVEIREEPWGLRVYVKSPPERGRANKELKKAVAKKFGVSASSVEIIKGETSRDKLVTISGIR